MHGSQGTLEYLAIGEAKRRFTVVLIPWPPDDPQYIVRLIGQVVTVSLDTVGLAEELSKLPIDQED